MQATPIGAVQCINKLGNSGKAIFSERDERLLAKFCEQARARQSLCCLLSANAAVTRTRASAPYQDPSATPPLE